MCAGCLQAEVHQLSRVNAAVTAENMQMKHELQQAHSTQQELVVSKQVAPCMLTALALPTPRNMSAAPSLPCSALTHTMICLHLHGMQGLSPVC